MLVLFAGLLLHHFYMDRKSNRNITIYYLTCWNLQFEIELELFRILFLLLSTVVDVMLVDVSSNVRLFVFHRCDEFCTCEHSEKDMKSKTFNRKSHIDSFIVRMKHIHLLFFIVFI